MHEIRAVAEDLVGDLITAKGCIAGFRIHRRVSIPRAAA
jgi:hypothetical protein